MGNLIVGEKENSRRFDICANDIQRSSFATPLGSRKHLEKLKQDEMIIRAWFFQESNENIITITGRKDNPKSLKH